MKRFDIIEVGDKIYRVYRIIPEDNVRRVSNGVDILKQLWHCDRAFKNNEKYYFVRDIIDIEYEEVTTNQ